MKTRELLLSITMVMIFFFGWQLLVRYLDSKHPEWDMKGQRAATQPATRPTTGPVLPTTGPAVPTTGQASPSISPAIPTTAPELVPAVKPELARSVSLGSDAVKDPTYAMKLTLAARGASVASVVLNEFKQTVDREERYRFQEPVPGHEDATRALATRSIIVDGNAVDLSNVDWSLGDSSANKATYYVTLGSQLHVEKIYEIFDRNKGQPGSGGYEILVRYRFHNRSPKSINVKSIFNGVNLPPRELETGPDINILSGYNDRGYLELKHDMVDAYTKEAASRELIKSDKSNPLLWIGASSVYFNAILRPVSIDPNNVTPTYLASAKVEALNPNSDAIHRQAATRIETGELTIAPGGTTDVPMRVFLGPRLRNLLNNEYYSNFPLGYDKTLVLTGGPCAFCTFQWLINILVWMLGSFHFLLRDWGLAIILLVIIVRVLLHPITKKSQVNMMRMGKMGPEIERLKKKYGDNKDELNKAMMQVYKEQGMTPILGCLPMFLQMPIWIALWSSLQSTFELRHAPFLWGYTWIDDLAKPDRAITWEPITLLFGWQLSGINLLPIGLAVVFFLQQKYTPKPPATTPEQEQQQKMMQWMSLLFPVFLYNGPAGLNLYIFTSTTLGIIESKRIRKHIKEQEEAEKSGQVIVDASPGRRAKSVQSKVVNEPKKSGLMGKLMNAIGEAQKRAEEIKQRPKKD